MVDTGRSQSAQILALPAIGVALADARGDGRWMRVTWHDEAGVVVLSLWRDRTCVGTIRLERGEVPELVAALVEGLAAEPSSHDVPKARARTAE